MRRGWLMASALLVFPGCTDGLQVGVDGNGGSSSSSSASAGGRGATSSGGSGPCDGITCDAIPAPLCVSATTLRTYAETGSCIAGTCAYDSTETTCPSGCDGAKCKASISASGSTTCVVSGSGGVKCWGDAYAGTGNNTVVHRTAVPIQGLASGITAVAVGATHACALTTHGAVKCWGSNAYGALGNGTTADSLVPVDVTELASGVRAIAVGAGHSCALTTAGAIRCWGSNFHAQLTIDPQDPQDKHVPVDIAGAPSDATAIAAGFDHTCALTAQGAVQCWGWNQYGALGTGSAADYGAPASVVSLSSGVVALSDACAITAGGALRCWGYDAFGQLGNGSTTDSNVPVPVTGLATGIVAAAAGGSSACALASTGAVSCWGWNFNGQLGDGSKTDSHVPVGVAGLPSDVVGLAVGGSHSCALLSQGAVKCWGEDALGQLGDNSSGSSPVPVDVIGL